MKLPTMQELFDKSALHLLKQGRRSLGDKGFCVYRSPNGDMCGVGPWIKDEFVEEAEGGVVTDDKVILALWKSGTISEEAKNLGITEFHRGEDRGEDETDFPKELQLLSGVQGVHDDNMDVSGTDAWPRKLRDVANEFSLNDNVITAWEAANVK